jgi:4a-hydroxytetrahydrobiopterin dehydratase
MAKPKGPKSTPTSAKGAPPAAPLAHLQLSDDQVTQALVACPEWGHVGEAIQRTFIFKDFVIAMAFVDKAAAEAERQQHHPDILIRYNKVTMTLSTHDAGGITHKDIDMARTLDAMA